MVSPRLETSPTSGPPCTKALGLDFDPYLPLRPPLTTFMSCLVFLSMLPCLSVRLSVSVCFLVYFYVHCCRPLCAPLSTSVCSVVDLCVLRCRPLCAPLSTSVYPWKWTGLSLHWSPPNQWVELCNSGFGVHDGIYTVCGMCIFWASVPVVCFIHINFLLLYLYTHEWNRWAVLLFNHCYMCRDTWLHTHIFTHHTPILLYSALQSDQTRDMSLSLGHRCCGWYH